MADLGFFALGVVVGGIAGAVLECRYWSNNTKDLQSLCIRQERELCERDGVPYQTAWDSLFCRRPGGW
jgi:hypothetical protein